MEWGKGIMDGMNLVKLLGVAIIGVLIVLFVALVITGIFGDSVVPALGLSAGTVANITAVLNTVYAFVGNLNAGVLIIGALVLIAIVIAVFWGLGFMGKGKGNSGNY